MSERDEVGAAPTLATPGAGLAATQASSPAVDATLAAGTAGAPVVAGERGHYVILRELARGGMGRILVARDVRLNREVALKELLVSDAHLAPRFEREARITARLSHPGIVSVHEAGKWPSGEPYYVMRLVAGRPFDRVLAEAKTAAARLALLPHVIAVADALAYAHSNRVIHRDLKPGNVLVGEFGDTVVIDWGLARELGEADAAGAPAAPRAARPDQTVAGEIMGTPAYMPPEQARGEVVDERADVYALGSLLYHLLSGQIPYPARTIDDALEQLVAGPPRPLTEVAPEAPPDLAAVVAKAMARQPAGRYRNAGELAADLKRFQTGQLVGAHRYSTGQLVRRFLARHRAATTAAAVALVVIAAIATYSIRRVVRSADAERAARRRAEQSQREAELRADDALLAQADGALARDPTQSIQLVRKLRLASPRWPLARVIAADAIARGVSPRVWRPDGGRLFGLALSPDGSELATTGIADALWLWPVTGTPTAIPAKDGVARLSYSGDGRFILTSTTPPRVWDRQELRWITLAEEPPDCHMMALPGNAFAVTAPVGRLAAWQNGGGCLPMVGALDEPPRPVLDEPAHELVWSPDGKLLALRSARGLTVVDASGAVRLAHTVPAGTRAMSFDLTGDWLALVGDHGGEVVELAHPETPHLLPDLPAAEHVVGGMDGHFFAIGGNSRGVTELTAERVLGVVAIRGGTLVTLARSPDGRWLATAGDDGTVALLDLMTTASSTYGYVADIYQQRGHTDLVIGLRFSPDSQRLYSSSWDGTVRVWLVPEVKRSMASGRLSPDARVLVSEEDGEVTVYDTASKQASSFQLPVTPEHWANIFSIDIVAPGGQLALFERNSAYLLVDLGTGKLLLSPEVPSWNTSERGMPEEVFSANGHWLAIARGGPLLRWQLPDARAVPVPSSTAVSHDVVFAGDDLLAIDGGKVLRWGPDGAAPHELVGPPVGAALLAVAPDGCCVAAAGTDEVVTWELASGRRHAVHVKADKLAFAPTRALALATDGALVVIDPAGQRTELPGSAQAAHQLAWDAEGTRVLARWKNELWMWDLAAGRARVSALQGVFTPTQMIPWKDGWILSNGSELRRFVDDLPREPAALLARLAALTQ